MKRVNIIGAGLAGSEAAWQLISRGIPVTIYEMRPVQNTGAHHTDKFAELVCSNSLRSNSLTNAVGLLKQEMRLCNSLIMQVADAKAIPAGSALAVDRQGFCETITETLTKNDLVTVVREPVTEIPNGPTIVATGPLTSPELAQTLAKMLDQSSLWFYDAAAPIVAKDSIDMTKAYRKSRYDKGDADYINCPMTRQEFLSFYQALITAEMAPLHQIDEQVFFEGCMPVEVMAQRGMQTLLYGPLKPVGLRQPDGQQPYAVVQLRQDDAADTMYNLVGFQTHLKWGEQKRVFQMIPGLEKAEFLRYGVMHRNTYLKSPVVLKPTYQSKIRDDLFFAGQMTGVEGYIESAASGLYAGCNMANYLLGKPVVELSAGSMMGAMAQYVTHANPNNFQPMNANYGILVHPDLSGKDKNVLAESALTCLKKETQPWQM
jgi:methylenetetrahydrofolate--tRNA-(uracil-5-)-methyltransferase